MNFSFLAFYNKGHHEHSVFFIPVFFIPVFINLLVSDRKRISYSSQFPAYFLRFWCNAVNKLRIRHEFAKKDRFLKIIFDHHKAYSQPGR